MVEIRVVDCEELRGLPRPFIAQLGNGDGEATDRRTPSGLRFRPGIRLFSCHRPDVRALQKVTGATLERSFTGVVILPAAANGEEHILILAIFCLAASIIVLASYLLWHAASVLKRGRRIPNGDHGDGLDV